MRNRFIIFLLIVIFHFFKVDAKLPEIDAPKVKQKINDIMKDHASHKEMTPEILRRTLSNYIEILDPNKTYFIKDDIQQWLEPKDSLINQILNQFNDANFVSFFDIHEKMIEGIERRNKLDRKILGEKLPEKVSSKEFKDMEWLETEEELFNRLIRIKALRVETSAKLSEELREKALQRIEKYQRKNEEEIQTEDPIEKDHLILSNVLKAVASALDAHTSYFTPGEATQFMISVQQRLFGIGAQLRDDLNGFKVIKIIEGGPAEAGKELKAKDRIVAVDGEPVVGMDIASAVELIRGKEGTQVTLTVIRESGDVKEKKEEQLDITITRQEVVLKETRFESSYEPFGDGVIAYLKLFSFYQDSEYSSAKDLAEEIKRLKAEHNVKGLVLDLRYNSGGMLAQAVQVTGLFITKGVVVGIKDNTGAVQYLRDLDGQIIWDEPLIVLVNKASASASEIVAQTLQDYGKAIIVGDKSTFGKGTFQTFTLNTTKDGVVNPEGEYKVTRGKYYTVSGNSPQLRGVISDVVVPGSLSELDIGEEFAKYPLENDSIKENFDDDLSDLPYSQRQRLRFMYKFDLQKREDTYKPYLEQLQKNSNMRVEKNKDYQALLKIIKSDDDIEIEDELEEERENSIGQNDLQLIETYNIMKDLLSLMAK